MYVKIINQFTPQIASLLTKLNKNTFQRVHRPLLSMRMLVPLFPREIRNGLETSLVPLDYFTGSPGFLTTSQRKIRPNFISHLISKNSELRAEI